MSSLVIALIVVYLVFFALIHAVVTGRGGETGTGTGTDDR